MKHRLDETLIDDFIFQVVLVTAWRLIFYYYLLYLRKHFKETNIDLNLDKSLFWQSGGRLYTNRYKFLLFFQFLKLKDKKLNALSYLCMGSFCFIVFCVYGFFGKIWNSWLN